MKLLYVRQVNPLPPDDVRLGGSGSGDDKRKVLTPEFVRKLNYSMWMENPNAGCEPPEDWQVGYYAGLSAANSDSAIQEDRIWDLESVLKDLVAFHRMKGWRSHEEITRQNEVWKQAEQLLANVELLGRSSDE